MKQINHTELAKAGIVVPMAKGLLEPHELGMDYSIAMDAQPTLISASNAGIPAFLTNYLDPEVIRVLVTPNKATEIAGEVKKGDWTTQTAMFPVTESTGEVSSYGDYNENGSAGANLNWPNRQSYLFQTITKWGELELDRAAEARINWAQEQNVASVKVLDKFMNNSYFFGIDNLENYGLLNDPDLPATITPATKNAGGTTWDAATAEEIFTDVQALYAQLVSQSRGLIDRETKMVMSLPPGVEANLAKTNQYNVNVSDQIKKNFPNLRIVTAVQYELDAGNLVQLMAEEIDGKKTAMNAFNEKLRAHPVFVALSSFRQKKTSGTWGCIIRRPFAIAGMLGV
ncbi:MAG TPA: major capsid family protein [Gammaproteobacteria bacterium]|nr:major capsid family protein [Gammaproteobacteria bacterium]